MIFGAFDNPDDSTIPLNNLSQDIFKLICDVVKQGKNSPDFICLFSSVWLIKLICVSPCIFNAFDFIGLNAF
ncbi:hypothetical protein [uncultured Gammaproteobacteria bacterium]|nr:hypothetical protein [uncultured Gammaproteobacteria bacterium]CAC9647380.1 hypothetical protein [uncultured Gammaproteobacteria bacterium]CAC9983740.1 hypothetical protein [uncultured Gammaproteobacteria bacterium]CAC9995924.1 hypothetical protein [uncultured Gammaproteobacteria bacterium]VVH51296.1 hypothetical protein BPUTSESOX_2291 [uncultured Gammaproteobacteria bacterium]